MSKGIHFVPWLLRRLVPGAMMFALVLLAAGCMSQIRNTGFLEGGYDSFNAIDQDYLKLRFEEESRFAPPPEHDPEHLHKVSQSSPPALPAVNDGDTTRALVFILPETQWSAKPAYTNAPQKRDEVLFTVRERMYRYLLRVYPHPVRVRYAYVREDALLRGYRVITITSNVTDYSMGSGALRYVFGWGAGEARIQIEGEIFEGMENRTKIGEYAIRRGSGAYAQNGLNVKVIKSDYCLRYAAEEAVLIFTQQLPYLMQGIETMKPGRADPEMVYLSMRRHDHHKTLIEKAKAIISPIEDTRRCLVEAPFTEPPIVYIEPPAGFAWTPVRAPQFLDRVAKGADMVTTVQVGLGRR